MTEAQQLPFDLGCRQAYERDDVWVSKANRDAVAWVDKWPEWNAQVLVIFGPPASGKTHLLQVWKREAEAVEVFAADLNEALISHLAAESKAVMIDDLGSFLGNSENEKIIFHLYNLAKESGGSLLLAADKPLKEYEFKLPDLKSRLMAAPAVGLNPPDEELMAVVITKLFSDRQIFVSQEVVNFIILRIERSFAAIRDLVEKLDRRALADKRSITIPL